VSPAGPRARAVPRIDFIGLDFFFFLFFLKKTAEENVVKIVKWSGTFTAKLKLP
jgi:hypothetical protein